MQRWNRTFSCDYELLEALQTIAIHCRCLCRKCTCLASLVLMRQCSNILFSSLWWQLEIINWAFHLTYYIKWHRKLIIMLKTVWNPNYKQLRYSKTCWKMHCRASHAILKHHGGFRTSHHGCAASQCAAGPLVTCNGLRMIVTCDIAFSQIQHVTGKKSNKDIRHSHFLKSPCKIGDPHSRAPPRELHHRKCNWPWVNGLYSA